MPETVDIMRIPAGTCLFLQGQPGDFAYLIQSGHVEVFVDRDGQDVVLACRGAGEIIGEMALIDGGCRSASARVVADCVLVPITAQQFEQRLRRSDPVLRMCLSVMIDRLRASSRSIPTGPTQDVSTRCHGEDFQSVMKILTLEREIEHALYAGEFELYLQPIVHLASEDLCGFEALIRWNHPQRGLVMPNDFVGVAEASGLILGITEWCLREVVSFHPALAAAMRRRAGSPLAAEQDLFVSVNISGHDLVQPGFADTVHAILSEAGMAARNIKLEVTESTLMQDPQAARAILDACRQRGMGIAVDDFGTGYSSLSYLSTLPITTLKVDRAFVRAIATDPVSRKVVGTIRNLARELDMSVVAEGIETDAQAEVLRQMDCDFGQGFLYARPQPLAAALDLIRFWSCKRGSVSRPDPSSWRLTA